jgi:hypothetical protein
VRSRVTKAFPLLLLLTSCGDYRARLKTAVTQTPLAARANVQGACDPFPFNRSFTFEELANGQGRELGERLKLCELTWSIDARLNSLGAESGCETPAGAVVLSSFTLEYNNDDGALQQKVVSCPLTRLSFESQEALQEVVNACFRSLVSESGEDMKKALSTKAKKLRIYASTSCAPDSCFSADWTITTVITDGLVSLGDCPK